MLQMRDSRTRTHMFAGTGKDIFWTERHMVARLGAHCHFNTA